MLVSKRFLLSRVKALGLLNGLAATGDAARSLYIPFGLSASEVEDLLRKEIEHQAEPPELARLIANSKTGAALFLSVSKNYLILPPFPIRETYLAQGWATEPLCSLLKHDFRIALILVRLGAYAIGICQGENLVTSKVGTGLVHGRHKKGGSSQMRFQRRREGQIEHFLDRVCGHVRERFEPEAKTVDYMVYGGARTTITALQKRCPFLQQFDNRLLPPLLEIPDPRKAVLESAVSRVWSSTIIEWYDKD